jgi:hypothetical protein
MTREELDTLWNRSVNESIKAGDSYARYRYAEYVAKAALAEPEQPQKARPDFLAGYDAGLADGRRIAALAEEKETFADSLARRSWETHRAAPPEPPAKREPATDEQVNELCKAKGIVGKWSRLDYHTGWRDAERFHGIRKEDGK